jgi:hypothetical protein
LLYWSKSTNTDTWCENRMMPRNLEEGGVEEEEGRRRRR